MRSSVHLLVVAVLSASCVAADAGGSEAPQPHILVSNDGGHFQYSMTHPESVRAAWIEVIDQPLVVDKKVVDVQAYGEFDWQWDWASLQGWETDEDKLTLGIWDPDGQTVYCDEHTVMHAQPGGEVSTMTVGGRTSFDPQPKLNMSFVRVMQGSPDFTFEVTGGDLIYGTAFHVFPSKAAQCEDRAVHAEVLDLSHARVTIGRECLRTPGTFFISASEHGQSYEWENAWIHVASRRSPELRSVTPSEEPMDEPEAQVSFVLRGKGFTTTSEAIAGYLPADAPGSPQLVFDTEYVSSTELRASVNPGFTSSNVILAEMVGENRTGVANSTALRIWVKGDEDKFELSEPRDVRVLYRNPAVIGKVSPFPIKLLNEHSPAELKITIYGDNFLPSSKVIAHAGSSENTLRTEYVSPNTLQGWLPRQLWRKHHVVYRLVVETAAGLRYSSEVESTP